MILAISGVTVAIVLYAYRDDIFQSLKDPGVPFQTHQKSAPLSYELAESWMSIPDLTGDPFEHRTLGDVFVVAPGLYMGGDHWNVPINDRRQQARLDRIVRPNYVDLYAKAGRVFSPYYRQASLYTFMTAREDARRAQNLAYEDVRRAFEYFLKNSPPERSIILAGHDQGASHVQRLLIDYFQGTLAKRLAVAYVIGHPLPLEKFGDDLAATPPCESETDTGCVVAFGAFMPDESVMARRFITRLKVYDDGDYWIVDGKPLLCTNPLLWNRSSDYAPRRLHKGGVSAKGLDPDTDPAPRVRQVGANCQDGILHVDMPKSRSLHRPIRLGGKFRTLPSNLFYQDLRENAITRVRAFHNTTPPRRVEKPDALNVIEIADGPVTPIED
ncbi:MAG: DUF3089 domain-containing protein [Hyphomonadaceae bacterium]|nr:DUF3089 domain-containing protein [Hyphomonadaceae bacterium]